MGYFKTFSACCAQDGPADSISVDDFVSHIVQMKGLASNVDVLSLLLETELIKADIGRVRSDQALMMRRQKDLHSNLTRPAVLHAGTHLTDASGESSALTAAGNIVM